MTLRPTASAPAAAAPRTARVLLGLLAALLTLLLAVPPAMACDCVERPLDEAIERTDLIASGVILKVRVRPGGDVTYTVFLTEVRKGEQRRTIRLHDTIGQTSCDATLPKEVGDTLEMWVRGADGEYTAGTCSYPHGHDSSDIDAALTERYDPAWRNPEDVPMLIPGVGPAAPFLLAPVALWSVGPFSLLITGAFLAMRRAVRPAGAMPESTGPERQR